MGRRKPVDKAQYPEPGGRMPMVEGKAKPNKLPKHAMHARGKNRGLPKV